MVVKKLFSEATPVVIAGAEKKGLFSSSTSIGHVLFGKMIPDALPLLVCQPNHPTFLADRIRLAILR
jgi:hypothetical protein